MRLGKSATLIKFPTFVLLRIWVAAAGGVHPLMDPLASGSPLARLPYPGAALGPPILAQSLTDSEVLRQQLFGKRCNDVLLWCILSFSVLHDFCICLHVVCRWSFPWDAPVLVSGWVNVCSTPAPGNAAGSECRDSVPEARPGTAVDPPPPSSLPCTGRVLQVSANMYTVHRCEWTTLAIGDTSFFNCITNVDTCENRIHFFFIEKLIFNYNV